MESLGIDSADIGLPGAGPHVVDTVTRLAQEIVIGQDEDPAQLRGADRGGRHPARSSRSRRRSASRSRSRASSALRPSGSTPRTGTSTGCSASRRTRYRSPCARGPPGHVRDRGHDPRAPRPRPRHVHDGDARGRRAGLRLRHGRARDAQRRAQPRRVRLRARRGGEPGGQGRLARPPGPRPRRHQRPLGPGGRRAPRPRLRARHRRARRQHADGPAPRQPAAARLDRPRPDAPPRLLRGGVRGDGRAASPTTIRSSAATPSAPARASTPRPSSRPARRATSGCRTASTPACPPR